MKNSPTERQKELWSDGGPYSQVNLKIETRILDESVSRVFAIVEAEINPFTFKLVKKNRAAFADDIMIGGMLDSGVYRGWEVGFIAHPFSAQISGWPSDRDDIVILAEANRMLAETERAVIRTHLKNNP